MELPYDPAISFSGIHPEKNILWKDSCAAMFTAALFIAAKTWKQPKCPPTDECLKKDMGCVCVCVCMQWNITQS